MTLDSHRSARRWRSVLWVLAALAALAAQCTAAAFAAPDEAQTHRLHALFDADWEWRMRNFPEWATFSGDHRYGDQLEDDSTAADAARLARNQALLAELRGIDRNQLGDTDRVSYDMLVRETQQWVAGAAFPGLNTLAISAESGLHNEFSELLSASPVATAADVRKMLARMARFPARVDQLIVRLRDGLALGWVMPRASLARVPAQIDAQLTADVTQSPLYAPFTKLGSGIAPAVRADLAADGERALREQVYPALRKLRDFIATDYAPRAPLDGAMSRYPGGRAAYDFVVRKITTTDLSAAEVHALGQREVARLRAEMEAQMQAAGFTGSFAEFVAFLNTDPRFFLADGEALLARYRDIAKRVDPELPKLFAELPRTPYGVRAIPAHEGPGRSDNYTRPPLDGSGPGWFNANTAAVKIRPTWTMETYFAHEAVPGHHLQNARALELKGLPTFRRSAWYPAYGEGWALYAETLGSELGLYKDPYGRFGHLQLQALRAARLVVDTGVHALGWQREQAITWMIERTGISRDIVEPQVDRYYAWPGQALAYMIGELKIIELRDRARSALGERFDIRRFHMAVLDGGPVPLAVLEQAIDDWIAAEKVRPAIAAR